MIQKPDEFYTTKHNQLVKFAAIANVVAWIILVGHILYVILELLNSHYRFLERNSAEVMKYRAFLFYLFNHPLQESISIIDLINDLVQGVGFWVILTGTSLGLNMIAETDLNYRYRRQKDASRE